MDNTLRAVDRWFRSAGILAILALLVTFGMIFAGADGWRGPFVAAHLAALVALLPLALALVVYAYREAGSLGAMVARHTLVAGALAVIAVTVTVSLMEFTGNREVRRIANLTSVAVIVLLVVHYLRWSRQTLRG
ncbi:MAG: hypothetical protein EXR68_07660 [Dehalococcoidia bacterium]|nr:hypothetical protein [Dehalococcoidia bacterium]